MAAASSRSKPHAPKPAKVSGQMIRVTDATVEATDSLVVRHAMSRTVLIERVVLWLATLDHESQQLILGTLSPGRVSQAAAAIAAGYKGVA